jgi:hypothetical protein
VAEDPGDDSELLPMLEEQRRAGVAEVVEWLVGRPADLSDAWNRCVTLRPSRGVPTADAKTYPPSCQR